MAPVNRRAQRESGHVFAWIALGFVVNACVAKPPFHCQSDDACVAIDGSRGTCEASGECTFHSALGNPSGAGGTGEDSGTGGTGGTGASTAGSASADGGTSSGGGGHTGSGGEAETAGAAGAACTDDANNCYTCTPQTSAQFLNACTSSGCVPFDDHARLTQLNPSGELPPLPPAAGQ